MQTTLPKTMQAIALNQFGGLEALNLQTVPVPAMGPDDVLIRVLYAGVGEWDPFEASGGYADAMEGEPKFPYIPGSEGSGIVVAVGKNVTHVLPDDYVYAARFLNPQGGFYAEYAVVEGGYVSRLPGSLSLEESSVVGGGGITALRGLEDVLHLQSGESILIFGAGGGIGHIAIQLAKRMGAHVFAVASGDDGVALAERVEADGVVEGHRDDILKIARAFAPQGFDTALLTAGGTAAETLLGAVRKGGRVAYPNGIDPIPTAAEGISLEGYNGLPDPDIIERLNRLIESEGTPFSAHVARIFMLEDAAAAHEALESHYPGKLALRIEHQR